MSVALTQNFQTTAVTGGPDYAPYAHPWDGTLLQWVPNGFDPGSGWIVTTTEVGYLVLETGVYTVKHTFAAASDWRSADASFAESGFFAVASYYDASGVKALHTVDNSSFSETLVSSFRFASSGAPARPGCLVSSRTAGKIVITAFTSTPDGTSNPSDFYVSTDYGATWAASGSLNFPDSKDLAITIHSPWNNNPGETLFYVASTPDDTNSPDSNRLYRISGNTATDISPTIGGNKYSPSSSRDTIATSVANRMRMLMVGVEAPGDTFALFLSNDGGDSWTVVETSPSDVRHCALSGSDMNVGWAWGVNGFVKQYNIIGNSAIGDDRSGDYDYATYGEIIGFAGW